MTYTLPSRQTQSRRFWLMIPVVTLPFLILLFISLGGGKLPATTASSSPAGINLQLPDAHFGKKKDPDKMSLYEASGADSGRGVGHSAWNAFRLDSSKLNRMSFESQVLLDSPGFSSHYPFEAKNGNLHSNRASLDQKQADLELKLKGLTDELDEPPAAHTITHRRKVVETIPTHAVPTDAEAKSDGDTDPEIKQLSQILDKVMAIQHPETVVDSVTKRSPLNTATPAVTDRSGQSTVAAVVPESQTLTTGSTLAVRLTEPMWLDSTLIRAGSWIYGQVSLGNERLKIQIQSIRKGKTIVRVELEAFDLDGVAGLYVPGSLSRDVSKESVDRGINTMGLASLDPSIGAQAASAGIQAAKTLIGRKVKLTRVTIPAGYQLLLRPTR